MTTFRIAFAGMTLVPLLALSQPASPPRVASLDWLAGTWVQVKGEEKVTESWIGPGNGLLVAANLTTRGAKRASFEFLRIADTAEGFSYYASPGGRAAVEFKLKERGERRIVFENAGHDFPQRVVYWREGERLAARIEGTAGGRERSQEWRFTRSP